MTIKSINPYNNELLHTFEALTNKELIAKIEASQQQFLQWRKTSFEQRGQLLLKVADILEKNKKEFARTITLEMGKLIGEAIAEVEKCAWCCRYYAENSSSFLQEELITSDASKSYLRYEPLGIVLAVMPWNFPLWQVIRFAAPALMAGNAGLLKHASNVPQCAMLLENLFLEAGYPEGVFQTLLIESKQVEQVIAHPFVKAVTLTGSEKAGASVASIAGKYLKKTVLELGGSDPFIVLREANIEHVATQAVKGRLINAGQSCIAAKRFIVVEDVYENFLEIFKQKMQALAIGNPLDEQTSLACMARPDLANELLIQVEKSVKMGAKVELGGNRLEGAFFEATILSNLQSGMPAYDEELFGPIASLIKVKNAEEAIQVANSSLYGLGGSVWSNHTEEAIRVAHQIDSGAVFVNGIVKSDPRLPFGGIKMSGYGRELSYLGIREFTNIKTIWVA